jgi:hypothetical protein
MVHLFLRHSTSVGLDIPSGQHDPIDMLPMGRHTVLYSFERVGGHIGLRRSGV